MNEEFDTDAGSVDAHEGFAAFALDRALRPQRVLLSVATMALLALGSNAGGVELPLAARVVVGVVAVANLVWNVVLLRRDVEASNESSAVVRQVLVDGFLALAAVSVVNSQSTPLAWILLLVPVLDAAARYGLRGALLAWTVVSLAYITLLMAFVSSETSTGSLLATGLQQIGAVVAIVGPVLLITSRLRSDLESTSDARAVADDQQSQLRGVSYAAQQMGSAPDPDHVLQLAIEAMLRLGFVRADVSTKTGSDAWRLAHSGGRPQARNPSHDPLLARALTMASVASTGVVDPTPDEVQALHDLGYRAGFAVATRVAGDTWIGLRAFADVGVRENSALFESLEALSTHTAAAWSNTSVRQSLEQWSQQLEYQALHDVLTGLPNRANLLAELEVCVSEGEPCDVSLLFLDLNGFKDVNDTLGHEAGDQVLKIVGSRLANLFSGRGFVSRLGGDEFVVVAPTRQPHELEEIAARITDLIHQPIQTGGTSVSVGTSIGIASHLGESRSSLMHRADQAMYHAKQAGRVDGTSTFAFADASSVEVG